MAPVAPEISIVLPAHNECADVVAIGRVLRETRRWPSYIVAETEADQRAGAEHVTAAE